MMRGVFITLEGADGAGKSTQAKLLYKALVSMGKDVLLTREPGGTPIGEKIREVILSAQNTDMCDITELLLYTAARAQLVNEVIYPALKSGKVIICDRFADSSVAYQGYARGLPPDMIYNIQNTVLGNLAPDATFFLDIPPAAAAKRKTNTKKDRLEAEGLAFQEKVYAGYKQIAKNKENFYIIDAAGKPTDVCGRILEILGEVIL